MIPCFMGMGAEAAADIIRIGIQLIFVALVIYLIINRRRIKKPPISPARKLNPELTFYSALVDLEIGRKPMTGDRIERLYVDYLMSKYGMEVSRRDILAKLTEAPSGEDPLLDEYREWFILIREMKRNSDTGVEEVVKKLKARFNRSVDMVVEDDCNNC